MMTFNDTLIILNNLFSMNDYRVKKCRMLFQLAQDANGSIVELGSYHGMSTIALSLGSKHQVYAIDDWNRTGWVNERYTQRDYQMFNINIDCAGVDVEVFNQSIENVAMFWNMPVSMIFWDTGVEDCLINHFRLWHKHLVKGGLFLVHDTVDYRLGWNELQAFSGDNWQVEKFEPLHGLRKL